ncbi:hypothetical protein [Streptosporangium sp. 'caverna']|uniref:hypothetical protein n=1 Tax=Streptosporangium sp. 'caverna' TaxID=2202249 RepID=UPI0013A6D374|nr:hypothetical protein [Streptosporangium sp. 'caverna']
MSAAPKAVNYTCTVGGTGASTVPYAFQMDLAGPLTTPTPNATVVATWKIGQPLASPFITTSASIPATGRLIVDADVAINGVPLAVASELRAVVATAAPAAATAGQQLTPPPMLITVTPTAAGAVTLRPDAFTLLVDTGTGTSETELLDCSVTAAEAAAGATVINVQTAGASTGPSSTPPATPPTSPSNTPPITTPEPTVTLTRTKTAEPVKTNQIEKTPDGAAATGGGGDAGPDARLIMFSGALMVAFAGIGGLVLRRRTATRG